MRSGFVTVKNLISTLHNHPEFTVCIKLHRGCCTFYGLDKCITCIHHFSIILSVSTALKIMCSANSYHPHLTTKFDPWPFYPLLSFALSKISCNWTHGIQLLHPEIFYDSLGLPVLRSHLRGSHRLTYIPKMEASTLNTPVHPCRSLLLYPPRRVPLSIALWFPSRSSVWIS